ncbi:hypothetical protein ABNG29_34190 [Bacillus thuringiensis]|uniref:hypothetical protein n=1 Tax=Bacillus thuringiensis TaxID=1428 RepID=UPI0032C44D63
MDKLMTDYNKIIEKFGGKIINLNLENKTSTINPLDINLNSKLNNCVVEPYIAETDIKREDIQLSELARWMENKVKRVLQSFNQI